jgi:hypothetical protein
MCCGFEPDKKTVRGTVFPATGADRIKERWKKTVMNFVAEAW